MKKILFSSEISISFTSSIYNQAKILSTQNAYKILKDSFADEKKNSKETN